MTEPLKLVESYYSIISFSSKELPEKYVAMVYSKWLRSLRFGNPLFKAIDSNVYYNQYHHYIEILLCKPSSVTRLAVLSDDHDVALGFSVSREDVLDFVHVHKDQRKQGIAKKLVPAKTTTFSHITLTAIDIWRKNSKYKHLKFNPFA